MLYSPQDLSCRWESNRLADGKVERAFGSAKNVIAYRHRPGVAAAASDVDRDRQ